MSLPDSVQDIKVAFLTSMSGDATLQTLLGASAGDPRIYFFFQSVAAGAFDGGGAYINYSLLSTGEKIQGIGHPVFKFTIWARTQEIVEGVRDRLLVLFDKSLPVTPAGRRLFGKCVHENDEFQEHDSFAGKSLHFRFGWLTS